MKNLVFNHNLPIVIFVVYTLINVFVRSTIVLGIDIVPFEFLEKKKMLERKNVSINLHSQIKYHR